MEPPSVKRSCDTCRHGPKDRKEKAVCYLCDHPALTNWEASYHIRKPVEGVSDGGSTDYYKLPSDAADLQDLIEHREMNFSIGNIFKACYRLGLKKGNKRAYELRKIIFFANRELARVMKEEGA